MNLRLFFVKIVYGLGTVSEGGSGCGVCWGSGGGEEGNPVTEPFLLVRVAGRTCALPLTQGCETLRVPALRALQSPVPGMRGMMVLRGQQTPVLDLAALLGFTAEGGEQQRLVAMTVAGRVAAFMVDGVIGVRRVDMETLQKIDLPGGHERRMGLFDEGFARVLDAGGLMPDLGNAMTEEAIAC